MNLQIQNLILLMISKKWVSHPSPPPQITPLFLARPKLIKQHSCSSARSSIQNVPSRVHSKCLDWSSDIILAFLISVLLNQDSWLVWHVFRPEDLVLLVWWQNSPFIFHSQKYKQPLLTKAWKLSKTGLWVELSTLGILACHPKVGLGIIAVQLKISPKIVQD